MGLDMYLNKKTYLGANYEHNKIEGSISLTRGGKPVKVNMNRLTYIEEQVAYWRKANHIHKWFVENVQESEDDCGEYCVEKEKLEQLKQVCNEVLADNSKAEKLLPTQSGFFFGNTEFNEWYFESLKYTAKMIEDLINESENKEYLTFDVYYSSSW